MLAEELLLLLKVHFASSAAAAVGSNGISSRARLKAFQNQFLL